MLDWFRGNKKEAAKEEVAPQPKSRRSLFGTHAGDTETSNNMKTFVLDKLDALKREQPVFNPEMNPSFAMDDSSNGYPAFKMYDAGNNSVSDAVVYWYASQGFIGAQLCGILAQNWLVNKACAMPGDDAIRKGYNIVSIDGDELDEDAVKIMKSYDRSMRLTWNMREFIRKGRIFGIRVAMFKVQSTDPEYYEKPFNIDGVTPNSYKGIVQVDPYWCAPMLDGAAASQPDTLHFYEPTWWIINGQKVHRSHLIIFRHAEPVDVLKPQYIYGGVPLTQQIMERVYAAERVANEAPQLAMSKRTTIWLTDIEAAMANTEQSIGRLNQWATYRDNYGIKLGDKENDEFSQFDTSLADFDALIMTQYQLVAAIAGVPATKLIGTTPKGFNSTGEYEEASYHELLESIQTHDLTPLAERHHALVIKSFVEPQLGKKFNLETTLNWLPLDTPTAEELAQTNVLKAQAGAALINAGAISSEEERQRVATDKTSGYNEIGIMENESPEGEELAERDFLKAEDSADKWEESKHPRAKNGQFGSGGAGAASKKPEKKSEKAEVETEKESKTQPAKASAKKNEMPVGSNKTDKHGFERSPNLSPKERRIETTFYNAIQKDTPKLVKTYQEKFGNVIDPDKVKKLNPSFAKDPSLASAVHEPSSYLSKVIWRNALQAKADAGDKSPTLFTAGGSGSGKSEAMDLAKAVLGAKDDALTFDSVLGNFKSATQKIDEALNITEGPVDIVYTNAPLELATLLNLKRDRTVRLDTIAEAHLKASENIKRLAEHYKDNPRVNITVVNNAGEPADLSEGKLSDVPTYSPEGMKEKITQTAKKLVAEGKVKDGERKLKMLLG